VDQKKTAEKTAASARTWNFVRPRDAANSAPLGNGPKKVTSACKAGVVPAPRISPKAYVQSVTLVWRWLSLLLRLVALAQTVTRGAHWFAAGFLLIASIFAFGLAYVPPEVEGSGIRWRFAARCARGHGDLVSGLVDYVGRAAWTETRWPLALAESFAAGC